jgi:hypothetical protein
MLDLTPIPEPQSTNLLFLGTRARRDRVDGYWFGLVQRFALIDLKPPVPTCGENEQKLEECTWLVELPATTYTFVSTRLAERTFEWRVFLEGGLNPVDRFLQIKGTISDEAGDFEIYSLEPDHHADVEATYVWTKTSALEEVNTVTYLTEDFSKKNTSERLTVEAGSGRAEFESTYHTTPEDRALVRWTVGEETGEFSRDGGATWEAFGPD